MRAGKDKKAEKKRSVFAGYTLSMLLATWVNQFGWQRAYQEKIEKIDQKIFDSMRYEAQAQQVSAEDTGEGNGDDWQIHKLYEEVTVAALVYSTEYQQISAAVYDPDGNLAARSTNLMTAQIEDGSGTAVVSWRLPPLREMSLKPSV